MLFVTIVKGYNTLMWDKKRYRSSPIVAVVKGYSTLSVLGPKEVQQCPFRTYARCWTKKSHSSTSMVAMVKGYSTLSVLVQKQVQQHPYGSNGQGDTVPYRAPL